jgi:type I restriction enzyme S subunit
MIRIESEKVLPAYLEHYLRSPIGNQLALGFAKAVAQPSLSMGSIRMIPVPIPPIDEQAQIVNKLEELTSKIDALDVSEVANSKRADHLRQAILKKAFSGGLSEEHYI